LNQTVPVHVGAMVYAWVFRSDKERVRVQGYGKVFSINKNTITVRMTWKEGKALPMPHVHRVPYKDIIKIEEVV
jgi:hypothetical protein